MRANHKFSFINGTHSVSFTIKKDYSESQKKIIAKLQKSLETNDSLFKANMQNLENGIVVKYDSRMEYLRPNLTQFSTRLRRCNLS